MGNPYISRSKQTEWETPQWLFDRLDAIYHFTLDVCASIGNAKCERFFRKQKDGLAQDWGQHTCWMNPPYGRELGKWIAKALDAARHGAHVVCLVPARTDSKWFNEVAIYGECIFLRGRLQFVGSNTNAPFPSMLIIFNSSTVIHSGRRASDSLGIIAPKLDASVADLKLPRSSGEEE